MNIQNIIWDVDGVLFDTYPAITYAISKTLNLMGCSLSLNLIDGLVRQSLEESIESLSQRFKLDPLLLRAKFTESYRQLPPAHQPPFAGAREVCAFIHQNGGRNVIVTHRCLRSAQCLLDAHALAPFFDDILNPAQGDPRKPDPAMVQAALVKYAMVPDETLLIGYYEIDIQTGQAAGTHTCLFGKAECTTSADLHIVNYQSLLDMLAQ